jgi:hypothetical protein
MTDAIATRDGYTKEVMLTSDEYDLFLLIKPDTDLDGRFKAWDTDEQEFIIVNGWLFTSDS